MRAYADHVRGIGAGGRFPASGNASGISERHEAFWALERRGSGDEDAHDELKRVVGVELEAAELGARVDGRVGDAGQARAVPVDLDAVQACAREVQPTPFERDARLRRVEKREDRRRRRVRAVGLENAVLEAREGGRVAALGGMVAKDRYRDDGA